MDGYRVLHVKGEPYEMGYQQGALLRDDIRENVRFLFDVKAKELKVELGGLKLLDPKRVIRGIASRQRKFVPERFFDEMRGIADGAGLDVQDIIIANFIPELFHCSGFALSGSATKDGTLYHGRILDYGCDWRLQDHAVLTVAEPRGQDPVRERHLCRIRRLGHGDERRAGLDRRDGRPGDGPLGRRADGLPGPDGPGRSRHARSRDRDLSRQSAHLRVLLRDRRRQDRQGGGDGGFAGTSSASIGMGESHPTLAARDQGRRRALGRRPLQRAGQAGREGARARSTPSRPGT